jgi:U3 small nucleolar RNA-associated protein 10
MLASLPERIEARLLLPALTQQLLPAQALGTEALVTLLELVRKVVSVMKPAIAAGNADVLFTFVLSALTVRSQQLPGVDVVITEGKALEVLVATVLKLSEARFKPLFLRMAEWGDAVPAHAAALDDADARAAALMARHTTFFRCVSALAAALRSVFTPYYGYTLDLLITALLPSSSAGEEGGQRPKKKRRNRHSGESVGGRIASAVVACSSSAVTCLHLLCLYDTRGFVTSERFERMLTALLLQLQAAVLQEAEQGAAALVDEDLVCRVQLGTRTQLPAAAVAVVAVLVQLASSAGSDALWKRLNHQVRCVPKLSLRVALQVCKSGRRRPPMRSNASASSHTQTQTQIRLTEPIHTTESTSGGG